MSAETTTHSPSIEVFRPHLEVALDWLRNSTQPEGALIQHHGISLYDAHPDLFIRLIPGYKGRETSRSIFVVERQVKQFDNDRQLKNPLTKEEFEGLRDLLNELTTVWDTWNGVGMENGSIRVIDQAGDGVKSLLETYHLGCTELDHGHDRSVRTWGDKGELRGTVFCDRGWFQKGRRLAVIPEGWR